MLPVKFSNQPPEQIISIYGFDKIGDHFILHFEHNDGTKSWGSVEFAKQLIPELTREYLSHPAHSHLQVLTRNNICYLYSSCIGFKLCFK